MIYDRSITTRFASEHPHWTTVEHYAVGIVTSLLFFVSILLHELAHSFVAVAKGSPVRSVTLFVFGGVAQIGREPDRPLTEFQIAIAGPIASALLAVGWGFVSHLAGERFEHEVARGGWLASINLMLVVRCSWSGTEYNERRVGMGHAMLMSLYDKLEPNVVHCLRKECDRVIKIMRHTIAVNGSLFYMHRIAAEYMNDADFGKGITV